MKLERQSFTDHRPLTTSFSCFRRKDVDDYGDVVADASRKDEEVPDGVVVRDALRCEEDDAGRVRQSARSDPCERAQGDLRENGLDGDDAQPPHQYVRADGERAE